MFKSGSFILQYIYEHAFHVNIPLDVDSNEPNDRAYI